MKFAISSLAKHLKEDIEFSNNVDKAWEEYESGHFKSMKKDTFLDELEKW